MATARQAKENKFVVILDAGHGGNDAGAIGIKGKEKNINLGVVLKLGKLIEDNMPDVSVRYTRKKDVFVGLKERTQFAHKNNGNLFISIHANSISKKNKNRKTIKGASTYVLGTAKNAKNLEIAQRENSVITLEDDYNSKYEGFDPTSPESYIIFETMQNAFLDQSVSFAALVQNEMVDVAHRTDRGVRQNGFYVLAYTGMPSVLVELDFICNPTQEKYMLSEKGQDEMAQAIYNAFVTYKASYDGKSEAIAAVRQAQAEAADYDEEKHIEEESEVNNTESEAIEESNSTSVATSGERIYKVQFMALPKKLGTKSKEYKGLSPVEVYYDKGYYKYTYGASRTRQGIENDFRKVRKLFKDAFIIVMQDGKRVE
ncbi:MAG: N-acetylmuramoyl-L-alanine amidase [Bacteroidaceae bacterium]|nr:N-acetylmuramoyl-L-alanine amidase [Bacteroidaceae bacterium]